MLSGIDAVGDELIRALGLAVIFSLIPLATSLVVGLLLSVVQAATQVQEQTLSFVPKLLAVCTVLFFCGGWMTEEIQNYFGDILKNIHLIGH